jgi:hypothetical protein
MRCQELDAYSKEKSTPTPLPALKDDWRTFKELFTTYLNQFRSNLCGIQLTYVIRDEVDPDEEEMDLDGYDSINACLVATSTLTHSAYRQDNTKVFNLLKPLIYIETSRYWQFASQFNQTQDGREAYLSIKWQAEGQSAVEAKKSAA